MRYFFRFVFHHCFRFKLFAIFLLVIKKKFCSTLKQYGSSIIDFVAIMTLLPFDKKYRVEQSANPNCFTLNDFFFSCLSHRSDLPPSLVHLVAICCLDTSATAETAVTKWATIFHFHFPASHSITSASAVRERLAAEYHYF